MSASVPDSYSISNPFNARYQDALGLAHVSTKALSVDDLLDCNFEIARASISASCQCIEALGNCCMGILYDDGRLPDCFDRNLPPLGKLDAFLIARQQKPLSRGDRIIQQTQALINLRNDLVHPSHKTTEWEREDENVSREIPTPRQYLKELPEDLSCLESLHADEVIIKLNEFLKYFFEELSGVTDSELRSIMADRHWNEGEKGEVKLQFSGWSLAAKETINRLELDVSWHPHPPTD